MKSSECNLSDELRAELVSMVEQANLESPEQVCDWVLDAARQGGRAAAIAELERAKANDRKERIRTVIAQ